MENNNTGAAPSSAPEQPPINSNKIAASETVKAEPVQKKKHTGLIVGIIVAVLLLIAGGVFAAFAIVKNQPENIAAESFNNLVNAKQVAISGTFSLTPKGDYVDSMTPVNVKLESKAANANQSATTTISVNYGDSQKTIELEVGEIFLNNGVFYLKASGIKKIYDEFLHDMLEEYLYSGTPSQIAAIESRIENIIKKVDDQWFEFSIEDILASELISTYLGQTEKDTISKAYDCSMRIYKNLPQYTQEISDLYSENKFLVLEPAQNSFYKVSFDADNLANYLNAIPETKIIADYTNCNNFQITEETYSKVSSSDLSRAMEELPNIYTKFDGFLNHHLTEVKVEKEDEYYSVTSDINIAYPTNLTITAPSGARPIMDLVQDVIQEITNLYQSLYE
ncbi:hypothetical protein J6S37_02300 [Candidatus Saccharibacteria bacterium]|nr:hypothetical protein [Candidatus Saccharibacteria bacterium]